MSEVKRTRWLWREGRFSWPFVLTIAYLAAAVFLFDLAWRTAKMPIEELLSLSLMVFALSAIALILVFRIIARRR